MTFRFTVASENIKGTRFINAAAVLDDTSCLENLSGFVNGYLILEEKNKRNFQEINIITGKLLEKFMKNNKL